MAGPARSPASLLGVQLDPDTFLREYWQKKPLLIRQGLPDFQDPLSAEELAGLACEEEVESRIVLRQPASRTADWKLRPGPFSESDFTLLPEQDWTLLVQAVDQWVPEVSQLLDSVGFLPRWRLDDIMVSYAEPGGGVGPHFDYYDVFIVQGAGARVWQIGQRCDSSSPLRKDGGLKVLEQFIPAQECLMQSGDVLYIPPGIAHHGVARSASMSYSIGFRAPSLADTLLGFTDLLNESLAEDERYTDPSMGLGARPGEIPSQALDKLERMVKQALTQNKRELALWFGRHMTEARYPEYREPPEQELDPEQLRQLLSTGRMLAFNPASRFSFTELKDEWVFFADGGSLSLGMPGPLTQDLVVLLSAARAWQVLPLERFLRDSQCLDLLSQLYNLGSLVIQED